MRVMVSIAALAIPTVLAAAPPRQATGDRAISREVDAVYQDAYALYQDLHRNPELSSQETQTAAKIAARLRALGYTVTERIGGTGVVGVLTNGGGPTIMLRTELDGLPVEERTGLPYASTVHAKSSTGAEVPVMHACGHDLHMASFVGAAAIMARTKNTWHGTLVLVGQPAEETISGAKAMVDDGLLTRLPKPDVGVALHVTNDNPAGTVAIAPGYAYANADSVRVTIYGRGGHGSTPERTIDPIVIAARAILALQTIVSREVKPGESAVVTVGYVRAGTKNNIIPDEAELGLTIRSYKPEVRKQVLAAVSRIVKAEADAGGAGRPPLVEHYEATDAVYNEPGLARRLRAALDAALGTAGVRDGDPVMGSEDYSYFISQGIPSFYFALGGADPAKFAQAKATGASLPSNHSSLFAPDAQPALRTGIAAEVAVLRNLLNGSATDLKKLVAERE